MSMLLNMKTSNVKRLKISQSSYQYLDYQGKQSLQQTTRGSCSI